MRQLNLTEEQLNYVIKNFTYKRDAAKYLNCSVDTLNTYLKKYNIVFPRSGPYKGGDRPNAQHSEITKEWMLTHWVNSPKSMRQLAEEFGVNESLIDSRRAKYNLKKKFCYPLNTTKLFNLQDVNVWYLAGLVATDGYLPKNADTIELGLIGECERELMYAIHDYFELTSPYYTYSDDNSDCMIRITAEGLNEFYQTNFGIPSGAKTFTVKTPASFPNEDCAKAYFRGCLDGDGTISTDGVSFGILTASDDFIDGLVSILNTYVGPEYHKRYEVYPMVSAGGKVGKRVLDWMYSLNGCFKLERKYNRYKSKLMI